MVGEVQVSPKSPFSGLVELRTCNHERAEGVVVREASDPVERQ
jgi:hypothetical protein